MNKIEVYSGYRQFYVWDNSIKPMVPEDWTEEDMELRIKIAPHIVIPCPDNEITAKIEIEFGTNELDFIQNNYDHFVVAPLEIISNEIAVVGWPDEIKAIYKVNPGNYSIYFAGYNLIKTETNEDYYRVFIKEIKSNEIKIIKQYKNG